MNVRNIIVTVSISSILLCCKESEIIIDSESTKVDQLSDSSIKPRRPGELFLSGYSYIQEAEESGDKQQRIGFYTSALAQYESLKNLYPNWKIDIVDMRIEDTLERIKYTKNMNEIDIIPLSKLKKEASEDFLKLKALIAEIENSTNEIEKVILLKCINRLSERLLHAHNNLTK